MKAKYKGAVFFDIDGTLVDERTGITQPTDETKAAIEKLRRNDYLVGISTGRAKCYVPDMGIDFDCYITCNGAVVEIDDEIIVNEHIEKDKLLKLVKYLDEKDFGYNVETRDVCYYGEKNWNKLYGMMKKFNISDENFEPLKSVDNIKANKSIVSFDYIEQFEKLIEDFSDDFLVTQHHTNNSGDVSIFGVSKATGIEAVIKNAGIEISDTYAFGDDANDLEMISYVGCGVAMTPHSVLLDGAAKMVTCSVAENGIAKALEKLGLI